MNFLDGSYLSNFTASSAGPWWRDGDVFAMGATADPAKLKKLSALTVDEKQMFRIGNTVNRIIAYVDNTKIPCCKVDALHRLILKRLKSEV
jgi:hypothetical protein